jgi:tetratricopeptide (TPR) repeat protein
VLSLCASHTPLDAQSNRSEARQTVRQSAAASYKRAEALIRRQKFEQAQALITKALIKSPDSGVFNSGVLTEPYYPHYLLGVIHIELEEYDKAILEFQEEERQGQIQLDTGLYETLTLQLAKARQTDNQAPVIKLTSAEPVETVFDGDREIADVRFTGVVVDDGGVASLTIHEEEINFKQTDDGFRFDETLRLDPVVSEVQVVATDVSGNRSQQAVAIDLPPLSLGSAAEGVHAILVGVDRYERHAGTRAGDCPQDANTCGDPSSFVCYNLANLSAAANDAQRFHDFLIRRGVPPENIQLLLSREGQMDATRENVLAALERLRERRGDKIIFFFAGHGVNSRRHKNLMLL